MKSFYPSISPLQEGCNRLPRSVFSHGTLVTRFPQKTTEYETFLTVCNVAVFFYLYREPASLNYLLTEK